MADQDSRSVQGAPRARCPVCGEEVNVPLIFLHREAEEWLINRIKKKHPEWVDSDGSCPKCVDAYREAHREGEVG